MPRRPLIVATALLGLGTLPAAQAQPAATQPAGNAAGVNRAEVARLLSAARMWEARNRMDMARSLLDKVLVAEPGQPDALLLLGLIEIRSNRPAEAERLLQRLRREHPGHSATRELDDAYRVATRDKRELDQIRLLSRAGKSEEAVARLLKLFPNGAPRGDLALDYYRLLSDTTAGRNRAISELRARVRQEPDNTRLQLGLASLLTDRSATRQEGLDILYRLTQRADADRDHAIDIWRRTLYSINDDPAYVVWFERYLKLVPDDDAARQTLARLEKQREARQRLLADPDYQAQQRGLRLLDRGNLREAEAALQQAARTRGNDAELVGALGLLRLREGRHDEARELFARASRLDAGQSTRWRSLIDTATLWGTIARARQANAQGKPAEAEALARQALVREPDNGEAQRIVAEALIAQDRRGDAEALLRRRVAAREPDIDALRLLAALLRDSGRAGEIAPLLDAAQARVASTPDGTSAMRQLRAELLSFEADQLIAQRRVSPAIARLEASLRLAPDAPWTRYTLARLYRDLGLPALGRATMEDGLRIEPGAEMRYAAALFMNSVDDIDGASAQMDAIPVAERTAGMRELVANLYAQRLVREARLAIAADRPGDAREALRRAADAARNDPQMLATVGREWIALGHADDIETGLALVRDWLDAHPQDPAVGVRLRYGELLAAADRDAALRRWLDDLDARGDLDTAQRAALDDQALRLALRDVDRRIEADDLVGAQAALMAVPERRRQDRRWWLALADLREAQGNPAEAAAAARRVLADDPRDADARLTLARLDERAGRERRALEIVREVLADTPEHDIDTRLSVARRLTALRREDEAAAVVDALARRYPQRGDITVQQGRIAQSRGAFDNAASLYRQARVYEQRELTRPGPDGTAAERALQGLENRRQGQVATAVLYSNKSGDSGISRLGATEIPLFVQIPRGYAGNLFFHADTVRLDAGTLPARGGDVGTFGQIAALGGVNPSARAQRDTGMALAAGYAYNGAYNSWRADLGTTPLGFTEATVVGGVRYRGQLRRASLTVDVSRRAVTSSLISYAGATDPISGESWGGVTRNGVRLGYSHDVGRGSVFVSAGAGLLTGHNVRDNVETTVRTGFDWPLLERRNQRVTSGLVLNYWRYQENLRYYTFGHGGYYSPQRYLSLSVPLQWTGRRGAWSWRLDGSAGWSDTYEKAMPYYPTRPDLQARAGGDAVYAGGSGGGFSYTAAATVEYRMAPHWIAGLSLQVDRSRDYAPNRAFAYLRYMFERQRGPVPFPPEPVQPYSAY